MRPTRILGIAPYEGMRTLMLSIAADMPDVALTAFVGDLEPGAAIAQHYTMDDFDVILSRGGTAELIREQTLLPVVEIDLSVYDILRAIKLAEATSSQYALVGFPSITHNASFLCEVLRYDLKLHTIHNTDEARSVLQELSRQGCSMVLCDMVTTSIAQEFGLPSLLITSGRESIQSAIRQSVNLSRSYLTLQDQARLLTSALQTLCPSAAIWDDAGALHHSCLPDDLPAQVADRVDAVRRALDAHETSRSVVSLAQGQYTLVGTRFICDKKAYRAVQITCSAASAGMEKYGIRYLDREETTDRFFHSFQGVTQSSQLDTLLAEQAQSSVPLMVVGEPGTGKDQMARLLYAHSRFASAPLCEIDCALLRQKGWNYLMDSEMSPLTDSGITLHFCKILSLDDTQFEQLFATIYDLRIHTRNRLIISASQRAGCAVNERHRQLIERFGAAVVDMPPLRTHRGDIPSLASLYISTLNMRKAKEIAGLEPEALEALEGFDWPDNYDQFKRVLQELVDRTSSPYIRKEDTDLILNRERRLFIGAADAGGSLYARGQTLEEINLALLHQTLEEEHGNQSATAQRLGISRTTLWRMLRKSEAPTAQAIQHHEGG